MAETPSSRRSGPIHVLVVDDHPAVRDAIADAVGAQTDMDLVGLAGSADEAFDIIRSVRPDVAVV
ncbi:MAG: DNA-binding response regulator, partial [Bacteroidota bacterium]